MPVNLEILARDRIILRARGANSMTFEIVRDVLIVRGLLETRVALRVLGPAHQRVPVSALQYLLVSQPVLDQAWHQSVIGRAHDVLAKSVQTVSHVLHHVRRQRLARSAALHNEMSQVFLEMAFSVTKLQRLKGFLLGDKGAEEEG